MNNLYQELKNILYNQSIQPVLLDIGASGDSPKIWDPIASNSIYIGFDPDLRELRDIPNGQFARSIIVNKAVTADEKLNETHFYLTQSPYCSSTLQPDLDSLKNYLFSDLFIVENEAFVQASALNKVFESLELKNIDWFKTDSQGTDLRIFKSLAQEIRKDILAVDIEPGLIDAYLDEDLFIDAHRELSGNGFWLSSLEVKGTVRMKKDTLQKVTIKNKDINERIIFNTVRSSPCWCEARYLRTLDSINNGNKAQRDYILLWIFAMIDKQWGFSLDIACAFEKNFGQSSLSSILYDLPVKQIYMYKKGVRAKVKRLVPLQIKKYVKKFIN